MKHAVLIDMNNLGFSSMNNPKLVSGGKETHGVFAAIKKVRQIVIKNPDSNIIGIWDGKSWRRDFHPEYKANRTKTEKQLLMRDAYFEQKKEITVGLEFLGVRQVWAANMEADDMAQYLARGLQKTNRVTLITADQDWQQLITPTTDWLDIINMKEVNYTNFKEQTGYIDTKQFVDAKCVLGDKGDNIKGIDRIGPIALERLYKRHYTFLDFVAAMDLDRDKEEQEWIKFTGKNFPKAMKEMDIDAVLEQYYLNQTLMNLDTPNRPKIEGIINIRKKPNNEEFFSFCYRMGFLSITKNIHNFMKPFVDNYKL